MVFYICSCGVGLDAMDEISSQDDRSSPVEDDDVLCEAFSLVFVEKDGG